MEAINENHLQSGIAVTKQSLNNRTAPIPILRDPQTITNINLPKHPRSLAPKFI
jgi:hypothetical protein